MNNENEFIMSLRLETEVQDESALALLSGQLPSAVSSEQAFTAPLHTGTSPIYESQCNFR